MGVSNTNLGLRPGVCTSSTRPASPYDGQVIYETDTDFMLVYNGTAWVAPGNVSQGTVAYAQVVADQTGIFAATDLTGMSVTWIAVASRRYRITVTGEVASSVADGVYVVSLTDTSNVQVKRATGPCTTLNSQTLTLVYCVTGLSGSITRKCRLTKTSGTGTLTFGNASATNPSFILVEDIGV